MLESYKTCISLSICLTLCCCSLQPYVNPTQRLIQTRAVWKVILKSYFKKVISASGELALLRSLQSPPSVWYLLLLFCSVVRLLSSSSTSLLRLSFNTLRTLSLEQGSTGALGSPAQLRWSKLKKIKQKTGDNPALVSVNIQNSKATAEYNRQTRVLPNIRNTYRYIVVQ